MFKDSIIQIVLALITFLISTVMTVVVDFTSVSKKVPKKVILVANFSTICAVINISIGGEWSTALTACVILSVIYVIDRIYRLSVSKNNVGVMKSSNLEEEQKLPDNVSND